MAMTYEEFEERLERRAEREMDTLDVMLVNGVLSMEEYEKEVKELEEWIKDELDCYKRTFG